MSATIYHALSIHFAGKLLNTVSHAVVYTIRIQLGQQSVLEVVVRIIKHAVEGGVHHFLRLLQACMDGLSGVPHVVDYHVHVQLLLLELLFLFFSNLLYF